MSNLDHIKIKSDILSTWITIIAALLGGWWAYDQYREKVANDKIERSLEQIVRFNTEPISTAHGNIEEKSGEEAAAIFAKIGEGEEQLGKFIVDMVATKSLARDINLIVEFYEHMHICACVDLCDKKTLTFFFGKNAYSFYGLFAPYIAKKRDSLRDTSFAYGVADLAKVYSAGDSLDWACSIRKPSTR
jgi:hypothetical protein